MVCEFVLNKAVLEKRTSRWKREKGQLQTLKHLDISRERRHEFPSEGTLPPASALTADAEASSSCRAVFLPAHSDTSAIDDHPCTAALKNAFLGFPWWLSGKESACRCKNHGFDPWPRKIPHATEQLSPCTPTIEPVLESPGAAAAKAWVPRACARQQEKPVQ